MAPSSSGLICVTLENCRMKLATAVFEQKNRVTALNVDVTQQIIVAEAVALQGSLILFIGLFSPQNFAAFG